MGRLMFVLLSALLVPTAYAGEPTSSETSNEDRARELYDNGVILYEEGRYEDAIVAWNEAYRLSEKPFLLFNIANAEERLGRYQEALDHLNRYRAYAPAEERDTLDRRITNLERRLQEQTASSTTNSSTTNSNPSNSGSTNTTTPPETRPESSVRPVPVVMFAIGGGGAIVGGVFGGLALSSRSEASGLCIESNLNTWCPQSAEAAIQADHTRSLIADIGFGVAILGATGGLISLVIPHETSLTMGAGLGTLTLSGRF